MVKSILNIESYSRGAIAIFNKNAENYDGTIGYMPQQIALDSCLTAVETINYFALLQNVDRHECVKVMIDRLKILHFNLLVNRISGHCSFH